MLVVPKKSKYKLCLYYALGWGRRGSSMDKLVLLKLQCAPKSPGESWENADSHSVGLGQHLRVCTSKKFPDELKPLLMQHTLSSKTIQ